MNRASQGRGEHTNSQWSQRRRVPYLRLKPVLGGSQELLYVRRCKIFVDEGDERLIRLAELVELALRQLTVAEELLVCI